MTRFSIVIPLFNKAAHIGRTLESVAAQSHRGAEVIVVDDGSQDGGAELVSQRFPDVRLLRQSNSGVGAARNTGLEAARYPWVAFLDADDIWLPHHLDELDLAIRLNPNARLAATSYRLVVTGAVDSALRRESTQGGASREINYFREAARHIGVVWTSATAVQRLTARSLGGFGPWALGEDLEFWARMALRNPVVHSSAVTALYVRGVGGAMEAPSSDVARPNEPRSFDELSPSAGAVASALASGRHHVSDAVLRLYLDSRVLAAMRQSLVRGDVGAARRLRQLLDRPWSQAASEPVAVSYLPSWAIRRLVASRRRIRSARE